MSAATSHLEQQTECLQESETRGPASPHSGGGAGKRSRVAAVYGEPSAQLKADGAPAADAPPPPPAANGGGGGSGLPIPVGFRQEMESFLGIDLAAVRIHIDSQARAAGARAFTRGSEIHMAPGAYDPDSAAGRELLGHELAHVAQQTRGSVPATRDIGGLPVNDDASLEAEADRVGAQAAHGNPPAAAPASLQPATPAPGVAQRQVENLSGNPNERLDAAGNPRTTHRSVGLNDAINAPAGPTAASSETRTTNVKVIATPTAPHHVDGRAVPDASRVYQENSDAAPPAGFNTITGFTGTLAAPTVSQVASKGLYINNTPTAADVQQAQIGDCAFLAATMSVVARDPGKITSMIRADGNGGGTVTLWRRQQKAPSILDRIRGSNPGVEWIQVAVAVNDQLAVNVTTDASNNRIHGAQLRAAPDPKGSDYSAKINGSNLEINRREEFEVARWAPILEKAYARFAQSHDTYGGARPDGKKGGSGYDDINGGWSHLELCVFYGPEADNPQSGLRQTSTTWTPGASNIVATNAAVMDQLILLQGKGAEAAPGETRSPILTATASVDPLLTRLQAAIPAASTDPDWVNVDAARQALVLTAPTSVAATVGAWAAMPPDTVVNGPKFQARPAIGNACVQAVRPGLDESTGEQGLLARFNRNNPSPVQFVDPNADAVPAPAAAKLTALNADLRQFTHPQVALKIEGHASTDGGAAENQALSQRRADNVEAALVAGGVVAPHTTAKTAVGETGARHDPLWRRVDIAIEATGHRTNTLLDPARSLPIRELAELMLDLRNIGTDNSPGQRNIYGDHVYSIVSVNIVSTTGVQVPLSSVPQGSRASLYPLVDPNVSTVAVRNPHHGNEPDRLDSNRPTRPADGAPSDRSADGIFTMSLTEFFRHFTTVESGVFPRS